jgi:hypothetical protein
VPKAQKTQQNTLNTTLPTVWLVHFGFWQNSGAFFARILVIPPAIERTRVHPTATPVDGSFDGRSPEACRERQQTAVPRAGDEVVERFAR